MNVDFKEDISAEEPVSQEEVGEGAEDDNVNGTMAIDNIEGVVGHISGNGYGYWERLQEIAPRGAFFIARKRHGMASWI